MKKILLLIIVVSMSLSATAQSKSQHLATLKEKNIKAWFSIISYGLKHCNQNNVSCRDEREEICLYAYKEILKIAQRSYYNELALAVSIRINTYTVDVDKGKINLIDYVAAYGDYEEKYKNLTSNELYRLFPNILVKD